MTGSGSETSTEVYVESSRDGRYIRYNSVLGKGAYKTVYKAFDTEEALEVAWNKLHVDRLSEHDLEKVSNEVSLLRQVEHKNIIHFYDTWRGNDGNNNQTINFITEQMMSGTLKEYLRKAKAIKLKVIRRWCANILEAIAYLHSQSPPIMHRDLKCDNIFINGHVGEVKIGDLGLSGVKEREKADSVIGTPEFMAPELYEESYTEKVDIYAFGMCLLEMVSMEYPYSECNNMAQIFKKVFSGEKPHAFGMLVDGDVKDVIAACLQREARRPSAIDLLRHPLFSEWEKDDGVASNLSLVKGVHDSVAVTLKAAPSSDVMPIGTELIDWSDPLRRAVLVSMIHQEGGTGANDKQVSVVATKDSGGFYIGLEIPIRDAIKRVEFTFDPFEDNSTHIAQEMVTEFQLGEDKIHIIREAIDQRVRAAKKQREATKQAAPQSLARQPLKPHPTEEASSSHTPTAVLSPPSVSPGQSQQASYSLEQTSEVQSSHGAHGSQSSHGNVTSLPPSAIHTPQVSSGHEDPTPVPAGAVSTTAVGQGLTTANSTADPGHVQSAKGSAQGPLSSLPHAAAIIPDRSVLSVPVHALAASNLPSQQVAAPIHSPAVTAHAHEAPPVPVHAAPALQVHRDAVIRNDPLLHESSIHESMVQMPNEPQALLQPAPAMLPPSVSSLSAQAPSVPVQNVPSIPVHASFVANAHAQHMAQAHPVVPNGSYNTPSRTSSGSYAAGQGTEMQSVDAPSQHSSQGIPSVSYGVGQGTGVSPVDIPSQHSSQHNMDVQGAQIVPSSSYAVAQDVGVRSVDIPSQNSSQHAIDVQGTGTGVTSGSYAVAPDTEVKSNVPSQHSSQHAMDSQHGVQMDPHSSFAVAPRAAEQAAEVASQHLSQRGMDVQEVQGPPAGSYAVQSTEVKSVDIASQHSSQSALDVQGARRGGASGSYAVAPVADVGSADVPIPYSSQHARDMQGAQLISSGSYTVAQGAEVRSVEVANPQSSQHAMHVQGAEMDIVSEPYASDVRAPHMGPTPVDTSSAVLPPSNAKEAQGGYTAFSQSRASNEPEARSSSALQDARTVAASGLRNVSPREMQYGEIAQNQVSNVKPASPGRMQAQMGATGQERVSSGVGEGMLNPSDPYNTPSRHTKDSGFRTEREEHNPMAFRSFPHSTSSGQLPPHSSVTLADLTPRSSSPSNAPSAGMEPSDEHALSPSATGSAVQNVDIERSMRAPIVVPSESHAFQSRTAANEPAGNSYAKPSPGSRGSSGSVPTIVVVGASSQGAPEVYRRNTVDFPAQSLPSFPVDGYSGSRYASPSKIGGAQVLPSRRTPPQSGQHLPLGQQQPVDMNIGSSSTSPQRSPPQKVPALRTNSWKSLQSDDSGNNLAPRVPAGKVIGDEHDQKYYTLCLTLMDHCARGRMDEVLRKLEDGADPNFVDYDRRTPLHVAAAEGYVRICTLLIENGATVERKDRWDNSPLADAIENGHGDVQNLLKSHGAVDEKRTSADNVNMELMRVAASGDLEAVRGKIVAGADVTYADYDARTPLHLACTEGHVEVAEILLVNGALAVACDRKGRSPIDDAVKNGHRSILRVLRQYGANLPPHLFAAQPELEHQKGMDLIEHAASGRAEAVRQALDDGAIANFADYDKRTALHLACVEGHEEVVRVLLTAGAEMNLKDRWGSSAGDEAKKAGYASIADELLAWEVKSKPWQASLVSFDHTAMLNGHDQRPMPPSGANSAHYDQLSHGIASSVSMGAIPSINLSADDFAARYPLSGTHSLPGSEKTTSNSLPITPVDRSEETSNKENDQRLIQEAYMAQRQKLEEHHRRALEVLQRKWSTESRGSRSSGEGTTGLVSVVGGSRETEDGSFVRANGRTYGDKNAEVAAPGSLSPVASVGERGDIKRLGRTQVSRSRSGGSSGTSPVQVLRPPLYQARESPSSEDGTSKINSEIRLLVDNLIDLASGQR